MEYFDYIKNWTGMPPEISPGILSLVTFVSVAAYAYFAFAWMTLAQKLKYKRPWLAWIPIANIAMALQLGGFHWAWIFLILVPVLGWIPLGILGIISIWRIFEKRNYPGWLGLSVLAPMVISSLGTILYGVVMWFVAWKDKGKTSSVKKVARKTVRKKVVKKKAKKKKSSKR